MRATDQAPTTVKLRNWALYAFAVFGWELVVLTADTPLGEFLGDRWESIAHWVITSTGWCVGALTLLRLEPWRTATSSISTPRNIRTASIATSLALTIGIRFVLLGEWKPAAEIERLVQGSAPWIIAAIALLAYYLAEALVIITLLGYAQRWGELRWGHPNIPWGGFALACTWGATHLLLQGPAGGVYAIGASILYGVLHCAGGRSMTRTFMFVAMAFIL